MGAAPGGSSDDFVLYGRGSDGSAAAVPVSTAVDGAVRFPPTRGGAFVARYLLPTARLRTALAALGADQDNLPPRLRSQTVDLVLGDDGEVSLRPTVTADQAYPVGTVAGDGAETVQGIRVDLLENWAKVVGGRRVDQTVALVTSWPDREGWQTPQRMLLLVSNVDGFQLAFGLPANPQGAEYHGPTFEAYAWDFEHPEVTRAAGL